MKQRKELVSVSDLAKRLGVTTQTIYNRVRSGQYKTQPFNRGKYKGYLVIYNEETDN